MMKEDSLIAFVTNDLNDNNQWDNACTYLDDVFEGAINVKVVFKRDHSKLYARLLHFCAENGGIIVSTNPATLATIVRVKL